MPIGFLLLALLAFVAVSFWWLSVDDRVPNYDSGRHLGILFKFHDELADGNIAAPFELWSNYPPLVHTIGALAAFVTGINVKGPVMLQNVLFLPLLVLGCYGAGTVAFDRRVGALAGLFCLATPMVISQFHVFMLDAPTAALVAVTVWIALASDRFSRRPYALAFGTLMGLGMLSKSTFMFFPLGLVLVMLARGGWRNWPNLLMAAAIGAAIAVPWHIQHLSDLGDLTEGAAGKNPFWYDRVRYPERWTIGDFSWYGWNFVNSQLYLPLALFTAVGVVSAGVGWLRTRRSDDYSAELIGGMVVAYVAITWISLNDPRYTLPCLVYFAVLGTAWIVRSSPTVRYVAATALVAILVLNTTTISFGLGDPVRLGLPNAKDNPIYEGQLTLVGSGFIEGPPEDDPMVLELMRAASDDGLKTFVFRGRSAQEFNRGGLDVFARMVGGVNLFTLDDTPETRRRLRGRPYAVLLRGIVLPGYPPPCGGYLSDGTGIFLLRGRLERRELAESGPIDLPIDGDDHPFDAYDLYCPFDGSVTPASLALPGQFIEIP